MQTANNNPPRCNTRSLTRKDCNNPAIFRHPDGDRWPICDECWERINTPVVILVEADEIKWTTD